MSGRTPITAYAPVVLRQLIATLHLVETLSSTLSDQEIRDILRCLMIAFDAMGTVLQERNEGMTFAREFDSYSPIFLLNSFRRSQRRYGYC
jgi:hypothetical protein